MTRRRRALGFTGAKAVDLSERAEGRARVSGTLAHGEAVPVYVTKSARPRA